MPQPAFSLGESTAHDALTASGAWTLMDVPPHGAAMRPSRTFSGRFGTSDLAVNQHVAEKPLMVAELATPHGMLGATAKSSSGPEGAVTDADTCVYEIAPA